jgi:hypothetical protein
MTTVNKSLLRADTWQVTATVDGRDYGFWLAREGGQGDSEETKLRLGGMGPQVSLGGAQTMDNITLRQIYDADGIGQDLPWLMGRRGKATVVCVTQPLDEDGNVHGKPFTYTGTLKAVTPPPYDAQGNDPAYIELEVATDGTVA